MTEPTNQASTADLSRYAISHQPLSAPPDHGEFHIELEGRDAVVLKPNQALSVPAGMLHRPVVPLRSAVIMIEKAGVVSTGD